MRDLLFTEGGGQGENMRFQNCQWTDGGKYGRTNRLMDKLIKSLSVSRVRVILTDLINRLSASNKLSSLFA